MFQFYISAIITSTPADSRAEGGKFQFYISAIITLARHPFNETINKFQFYISAIITVVVHPCHLVDDCVSILHKCDYNKM